MATFPSAECSEGVTDIAVVGFLNNSSISSPSRILVLIIFLLCILPFVASSPDDRWGNRRIGSELDIHGSLLLSHPSLSLESSKPRAQIGEAHISPVGVLTLTH